MRSRGADAWSELLARRACGVTWRAMTLLAGVEPSSPQIERRVALRRAAHWLALLPERLALEQEDALDVLAATCGYSSRSVARAFHAQFCCDLRAGLDRHRSRTGAPERGL